jgi:hypothetical protein
VVPGGKVVRGVENDVPAGFLCHYFEMRNYAALTIEIRYYAGDEIY